MITMFETMILVIPAAVFDIRKREIPLLYIAIIGLAAALFNTISGWLKWYDPLVSLFVGGVFLLIARFSRESIGYGDGFLIAAVGFCVGFSYLLGVLLFSFLTAGLFGLALLALKKKNRHAQLPYAPFIGAFAVLFAGMQWAGGI